MKRRPFALLVPPVLALLGAVVYIEYRVATTERAVAEFCRSVTDGLPARDFAARALARGLEVHDLGAGNPVLVASRQVYGWRQEAFECRAVRDEAGLVRTATSGRRRIEGT